MTWLLILGGAAAIWLVFEKLRQRSGATDSIFGNPGPSGIPVLSADAVGTDANGNEVSVSTQVPVINYIGGEFVRPAQDSNI